MSPVALNVNKAPVTNTPGLIAKVKRFGRK